jgi:hypothetical protein
MSHNDRTVPGTGTMKNLCLIAIYSFLLSGAVIAAPVPQPRPQTETEVAHLLDFVRESTCQFNRNDTWYDGKDARQHLEMKYDALAMKGMIGKAEDFIDKAASKSSLSGKDYQIRCQDGKTISSAQWLSDELMRFRKQTSGK